ncbi:hypothetical protein [Paractinoplanes durhamensis]|uniref:Uncharacterized protein n=1 Tax=Paractinoplanes durhamensis TaxID=113563 RepID=A0ABQ3Z9L4_9ACTN|nr:hypothetical protein [Actinoplanes durhamensis]GIE06523.1 hypothetical protein Adu01nite_78730 [Actinoplanes durhamensis]
MPENLSAGVIIEAISCLLSGLALTAAAIQTRFTKWTYQLAATTELESVMKKKREDMIKFASGLLRGICVLCGECGPDVERAIARDADRIVTRAEVRVRQKHAGSSSILTPGAVARDLRDFVWHEVMGHCNAAVCPAAPRDCTYRIV